MTRFRAWSRRRLVASVLIAVGAVALGGTALAGHVGSGVKSYTGCLVPGDGVIIKVKEGNAPRSACTGGQTQVHLSGGDITKITVTGGLTGGGDNGEVTIGLDPKYGLPQGCTTGQVAKWNNSTSSWGCAADQNTTYSSGTGLSLSGTEFSIAPSYRVQNTPDCASGEFATGFDSDGEIQCSKPSPGGVEVWQMTTPAGSVILLPKGEGVDLIKMPLPAGTYLMTAVATVADRDGGALGDEAVYVRCGLRNAAFAGLPVRSSFVDIGEELSDDGPAGTIVVHGVLSLASADTVRLTCTSSFGDDDPDRAHDATMTAVKVATVHSP